MAPGSDSLITLRDVVKAYETAAGTFVALDHVGLEVRHGEFVGIIGKSVCGKSTLINVISGIDRPTSGEVSVDGMAVNRAEEGALAEWRGRHIGVIFQFFQLLPMLTAVENVMLPMDFCDVYAPRERPERALRLLEDVGVAEVAEKLPAAMAGGQQQRVAIARALANDPPIIVADEPTGNLDSQTADAIFDLFARLAQAGKTVVLVSHDPDLLHRVGRTITLVDGHLGDNGSLPTTSATQFAQNPVARGALP